MSIIQDGANASEAKVCRAHAPPQGACENLLCVLKLLANVQAGGDDVMDTVFEEQSRLKITNGLEVHRGGPPGGDEGLRSGEIPGSVEGGQAQVQEGDVPRSVRPRGGGRVEFLLLGRVSGRCCWPGRVICCGTCCICLNCSSCVER